jgi:integrase
MNAALASVPESDHGEAPGLRGLLAKLLNAVRPEFRQDMLLFGPEDPVFGHRPCRVVGCRRTGRTHGLCPGHDCRWTAAGRPDLDHFVAITNPKMQKYQRPGPCLVPGCQRGIRRAVGLCQAHDALWRRHGEPELGPWLDQLPATKQPDDPSLTCRVGWCDLWPEPTATLCQVHHRRWLRRGRPDIARLVDELNDERQPGYEVIDLRPLPPRLRLELQYALQRRRDDGRVKTHPSTIQVVVSFLVQSHAQSLLDRSLPEWRDAWNQRYKARRANYLLAAFAFAHRMIEDLHLGSGWDLEFPRDVWRLRSLGFDSDIRVNFGRIGQPWLKELAKRWLRQRLSSGLSLNNIYASMQAINAFSHFLSSSTPKVKSSAQVDRLLLERYLADLSTQRIGLATRVTRVGQLNTFLTAVRMHGWDSSLPANAVFLREDYPKRGEQLPRALSEHVMAQLEDPGNLNRWTQPVWRLVTIILMRCGLRGGDALRLPSDCIVRDRNQAPYLKYFNGKMKREALVPIDHDLEQEIDEQQRRNQTRWPQGTPVLFPRRSANPDGTRPVGPAGYRAALIAWLKQCDIRDEYGSPITLTPHQWRHTLGTRLINRDVPQDVVRQILDHSSHTMTAHYARLADTTIRRHWERAQKVDVHGNTVIFDPDGPVADAEWAKQRLSRATQALPNGYCGLPLARSCPHANACLTCPMFLTTSEFLPQHRQQRLQTLQIINRAEAKGQSRLAEMNRQVAGNLEKIISALEIDGPGQVADAG